MKAIDRFYTYLAEKSLKPTVVEKEIGLSNGYLSAQKKRGADVGEGVLLKIIDYFRDVNPMWLLTGEGSMLRNEQVQPISPTVAQADSSGEAAIYYKMYKEEKAEKEVLIEEVGGLKERLRQLEASIAEEPAHPPLIEKAVDAFTPDSLGGSGKDFIHTRKPTPSKTSSASKIL